MRLNIEVAVVKNLRAEITSSVCDYEKTAASLTNTANMSNKAVKRADSLSARIAASIRWEDVYKPELTAVKEYLIKARAYRINVLRSVSDLVLEVRQPFFDVGDPVQAKVGSFNRSSEDAANKTKLKMGQACKQMLCLLDVEYVIAMGKIRTSVVRSNDDVLSTVSRCTAIILTRLDKICMSLSVKGDSDTANAWSVGPVENLGEHRWIVKGQLWSGYMLDFLLVLSSYFCFCFKFASGFVTNKSLNKML